MRVGIIGNGYLGQAYAKVFPEALIHDPKKGFINLDGINAECELAIVAVPTDPIEDGTLDMSIVESVVDELETPLILIKSALMPGTVDRLVKKTGKKIAVSVELIGMGKYFIPPHKYPDPEDPRKHQTLIIGGELETASRCAEFLWDKMSPDIRIHLLTAKEAEMCKLIENAYGALKVTFINTMYNFITKSGGSFIRTHQAWTSDGRVDGVHLRTLSWKRGWKSHCWSKDIPALARSARDVGADDMAELFEKVIELNEGHLEGNS